MDITMLGTGNAMVTECYNTCFVLRDGDKHLLVDGGGGNTLLAQLKHAGFDWMDMREIFVTHKHVDHIMGVVWMIRMICQHMKQGQYEGEATIYGHEEVIRILKQMAEMLYPKKQTCYIGDRLHLVVVEDGEERTIMGHKTTFFDIQSTKAKQFGFCMDMGNGDKFTCCGDEPYNDCEKKYAENIRETSLHSQRRQRTGRAARRTEPDPLPHRGQEHRPPQRTLHRRRKEILPRKSLRPGGSGENRIIIC